MARSIYLLSVIALCCVTVALGDDELYDKIDNEYRLYMHRQFQWYCNAEENAISEVNSTVPILYEALARSIDGAFIFSRQILEKAKNLTKGTSSEQCVAQVAASMETTRNDSLNFYNNSTASVPYQINLLNIALQGNLSAYQSAFDNAQDGMAQCRANYSGTGQAEQRQSCAKDAGNKYLIEAKRIADNCEPSKSMRVFGFIVLKYLEEALQKIVEYNIKFPKKLLNCTAGIPGAEELNGQLAIWNSFTCKYTGVTLPALQSHISLVSKATPYFNQFFTFPTPLVDKFLQEKDARNFSYYQQIVTSFVSSEYTQIATVALNNCSDVEANCSSEARRKLDEKVASVVNGLLSCDSEMVKKINQTKDHQISQLYSLRGLMSVSNVVYLKAMSAQNITICADNTLKKNFDLKTKQLALGCDEIVASIQDGCNRLNEEEEKLKTSADLPCGKQLILDLQELSSKEISLEFSSCLKQ